MVLSCSKKTAMALPVSCCGEVRSTAFRWWWADVNNLWRKAFFVWP